MMARETFARWTCDRCKSTVETFSTATPPAAWRVVRLNHLDAKELILENRQICGDCVSGFMSWLKPAPKAKKKAA